MILSAKALNIGAFASLDKELARFERREARDAARGVERRLKEVLQKMQRRSRKVTGFGIRGWEVSVIPGTNFVEVRLELKNSNPASWNRYRTPGWSGYTYRGFVAVSGRNTAHKSISEHRKSGCTSKASRLAVKAKSNPRADARYIEKAFAEFGMPVVLEPSGRIRLLSGFRY